MISLSGNLASFALSGADASGMLRRFSHYDRVRQIERESIREFVSHHRKVLQGRVLDFGSGEMPYRCFVDGEYVAYEAGQTFPEGRFDAVLCTQVLQYVPLPGEMLALFRDVLRPGGKLLLTYPTNWDEVEGSDLWRFTKAGMERLLSLLGFQVQVHERRAEVQIDSFRFPLGYGCIATK